MKKPLIALTVIIVILALGATVACADSGDLIYRTTQQVVVPGTVTPENAKELRIAAMEAINAIPAETQEDRIRQRLYTWWGEWQPDYEGWLQCANDLYAEDAAIYAIGGEQRFSDYKASMKGQRSLYTMEMGPIQQMTVDGNTATLVYTMFLTPKGGSKPMSMLITEFNSFEEIDGKLMVTRLDLYTDGGSLASGIFAPLKWGNLIALLAAVVLSLVGTARKKRVLIVIGSVLLAISFVALAFLIS